MKLKNLLLIALPFVLVACITIIRTDYIPTQQYPKSKNQNVCDLLTDTVLVYAVFVDVGIYHPWTEFEIEATMDSLNYAMNWIEKQANQKKQSVYIKTKQHKQNGKLSIKEKSAKTYLKRADMATTIYKNKKLKKAKRYRSWSNAIASYAGRGLKYRSSKKMATNLRIGDAESFISALRDIHNEDDIALIFFVNGFYENHQSFTFNSNVNYDVEYSLISNRNPAVIAHEFLHLFGAVDLYPTPGFAYFNFEELKQKYPNDIMLQQHKNLEKAKLSPITDYFIGWSDTLNYLDTRLLIHKGRLTSY